MSLTGLIAQFSNEFHRCPNAAKTTYAQRRMGALEALRQMADQRIFVRPNNKANAYMISGRDYVLLPFDYLDATRDQLAAIYNYQNSFTPGELINPGYYPASASYNYQSSNSFALNAFGSQLGATDFGTRPDNSSVPYVPISSTIDGRACIRLVKANNSTNQLLIAYNARHQIEDAGKLLTVNSAFAVNDTIEFYHGTANNVLYTFKTDITSANDILIGSDIYDQAEKIADSFNTNLNTNGVPAQGTWAYVDGSTVQVRPFTDNDTFAKPIILLQTSNTTALTISYLPPINTLSYSEQRIIIKILTYNVALSLFAMAVQNRDANQASILKDYIDLIKSELSEFITLGGLNG